MTRAVPRWVQRTTVAAVIVVAGVAAIVSYAHMRHLAERAGEEWRADILPLSVDGLLVAASLVLLVRRKAGRRAGVLPWVGLLLGVGASLAANVAAAQPTMLGRVVAAWPPVAFAVSFEMLILVMRDGRRRLAAELDITAQGDTEGAGWAGDGVDDRAEGGDRPDWWGDAPFADTPEGRAAELIDSGAGRRRLSRELDISEHQARQLLAERAGAVQ